MQLLPYLSVTNVKTHSITQIQFPGNADSNVPTAPATSRVNDIHMQFENTYTHYHVGK